MHTCTCFGATQNLTTSSFARFLNPRISASDERLPAQPLVRKVSPPAPFHLAANHDVRIWQAGSPQGNAARVQKEGVFPLMSGVMRRGLPVCLKVYRVSLSLSFSLSLSRSLAFAYFFFSYL